MMPKSPLFGRRIHISGSIDKDPALASPAAAAKSCEFITDLVKELVKLGANFVIPVDGDLKRDADDAPICFDWVIWKAIHDSLSLRPANVPGPLAVAVQHHKTKDQIPEEFMGIWDNLCAGSLLRLENAAHWNMASKRMEAQARYGDILITLGGSEGVLYLANLYHDVGRPVIPLNFPIIRENAGSRRLFNFGLTAANSSRLFRIAEGGSSHDAINRIWWADRIETRERVASLVNLLEALERPTAFAVRLLDPNHKEYSAVQDFFDTVVEPVLTRDLGYQFSVIDGVQAYHHARIDQEIFEKLHRSSLVIADMTGERPNCYLELGYALGRRLPTMVTARAGSETPFDLRTYSAHHWNTEDSMQTRQRAFREHWDAIQNRPPLVAAEGLIL